jgi:hypothetical protein
MGSHFKLDTKINVSISVVGNERIDMDAPLTWFTYWSQLGWQEVKNGTHYVHCGTERERCENLFHQGATDSIYGT